MSKGLTLHTFYASTCNSPQTSHKTWYQMTTSQSHCLFIITIRWQKMSLLPLATRMLLQDNCVIWHPMVNVMYTLDLWLYKITLCNSHIHIWNAQGTCNITWHHNLTVVPWRHDVGIRWDYGFQNLRVQQPRILPLIMTQKAAHLAQLCKYQPHEQLQLVLLDPSHYFGIEFSCKHFS